MDGATFDRLVRTLGKRVSRRGAVGVAGTLAIAGIRGASANQLTPSTCGASGDVCTMLMGCCDGLTCVTSAINTNYGVCVAGEGGTVSIGTTLISPFSENVEQEVAAIAASETTSTTTTTDPALEREQRLAEIKARKDARRTEQQSRRTTQKTTQQTRRDDRREARELRRGPKLVVSLSRSRGEGDPDVVRIINRDDISAFISGVEFLPDRRDRPKIERTLQAGDSLFLLSGLPNDTQVQADEVLLSNQAVCGGSSQGAGYAVAAGFSEFVENHEFIVLCDGSNPNSGDGNNGPRKKRRKRDKNKS